MRVGQRLRLALAMIDAVGKDGYRETRVADVIARAGVSRKTFYELFDNKQDCLLTTFDLVTNEAMRRIDVAYRAAKGWPDRMEAAIGALLSAALENPGAVRLYLLETPAVGPAGIERRERSVVDFERSLRAALELAPGKGSIADAALKAIVGGLNRVVYRRALRGDPDELTALAPDLTRWAASYYPAPAAMISAPAALSGDRRQAIALGGGRAPGTLAPHPALGGRRGLPRGDQNVSRSFVVQSQRERILDAVTNLTAEQGYAALRVEGIAEQAAVSLVAFYEHFADKEDAFLVAFEVGQGKGLAIVESAFAAQEDWRFAVRDGIAALFDFLATEPSFAHIALVDALIATGHTAQRSSASVDAFAQMLVPGLERTESLAPPAVTVEAIAGGLFELCLHYALGDRIRELPELAPSATYIALAPFIGGEEAARIATDRPQVKRAAARA
ncbi:MAG TPA: TetR/AcrR family transcriptional regulator [Solirubrobacteraceae bacterium]|jgi:AcrR family transcriptional regulator|nr:TetR/AcrR family transcriptional regulator [Solirubrobacteraceae bacterium]